MKLHLYDMVLCIALTLSFLLYFSSTVQKINNARGGRLEVKSWYASLRVDLEILSVYWWFIWEMHISLFCFLPLFSCLTVLNQVYRLGHFQYLKINLFYGSIWFIDTILPWTPTKYITNQYDFIYQFYYLWFICNSIAY